MSQQRENCSQEQYGLCKQWFQQLKNHQTRGSFGVLESDQDSDDDVQSSAQSPAAQTQPGQQHEAPSDETATRAEQSHRFVPSDQLQQAGHSPVQPSADSVELNLDDHIVKHLQASILQLILDKESSRLPSTLETELLAFLLKRLSGDTLLPALTLNIPVVLVSAFYHKCRGRH